MTDETKKHASEDTPPPADIGETFDAETLAGLSEEDDAPDNTEALFVLIDGLKGENADLKDRYLRLAADMDNLRRRTERDVRDAKSYAIANFARDMLAVSDNLRRGLDAVPAEAKAGGEGGLAGLIEGVEVTERAMLAALERHGVRKIDPKGQKFDPNFHQAMFEMPNPDVPNNTVMQVVQDGYVIGERVLRPAMVGVAKGGPKNADAPQPAEAAPREAEPQTGDAEPGAPNAESEKDA